MNFIKKAKELAAHHPGITSITINKPDVALAPGELLFGEAVPTYNIPGYVTKPEVDELSAYFGEELIKIKNDIEKLKAGLTLPPIMGKAMLQPYHCEMIAKYLKTYLCETMMKDQTGTVVYTPAPYIELEVKKL